MASDDLPSGGVLAGGVNNEENGSGAPLLRVRRSAPLLLTVAGLVVLLVAGLIWWQAQPPPNVGAATATALAGTPTPAPSPAGSAPVASGALPSTAAELAPVALSMPTIHVTAKVVPTGVDSSGQFDVPPSVDTVGWYKFGPGLAATAGSVVIGGHVDSAAQGEGAFFRLRELHPGDRLTVTGADGAAHPYQVVSREEYPKTTIDLTKYFSWTGAPRLTLITCGGKFNDNTRHYQDNVVVTAVPAP